MKHRIRIEHHANEVVWYYPQVRGWLGWKYINRWGLAHYVRIGSKKDYRHSTYNIAIFEINKYRDANKNRKVVKITYVGVR